MSYSAVKSSQVAKQFSLLPVLALLGAFLEIAAAAPVFPGKDWEQPPPDAGVIPAAKVEQAMDYLKTVVGKNGNSGTLIIQDGYLLWSGADTGKMFAVYSCTKSFLSTCLGLLWDDGKCTPDDLVSKYLPELAREYPEVTLRDLATFTSGLHLEKLSLDPGPPDFTRGTAMHYSPQSDILAYALTKVAGESLRDLFKRRIADPIGMDPAGWEWGSVHIRDGVVINGGAGRVENGVHITARNLARFGWLYANNGNWNGKQLISGRYIEYATKPLVDAKMPMHDQEGWYKHLPGTYGLNWWTNGVTREGRRIWPALPERTFAAQGNQNNICVIVPELKMVFVRTAHDQVIDVMLFDPAFEILREGMASREAQEK